MLHVKPHEFSSIKIPAFHSFGTVAKEDNKRTKYVLSFSLLGFLFQENTYLLPSESHSFFPYVTNV